MQVYKFMVNLSHAARLLGMAELDLVDYLRPYSALDFRTLIGSANQVIVGEQMPGHSLPSIIDPNIPTASAVRRNITLTPALVTKRYVLRCRPRRRTRACPSSKAT